MIPLSLQFFSHSSNNPIAHFSDLENALVPTLKTLVLTGCPICDSPSEIDSIKQQYPSLKIVGISTRDPVLDSFFPQYGTVVDPVDDQCTFTTVYTEPTPQKTPSPTPAVPINLSSYDNLEFLGRGAFSTAYRGRRISDQQEVCLKAIELAGTTAYVFTFYFPSYSLSIFPFILLLKDISLPSRMR